jgi:hypothetical protein
MDKLRWRYGDTKTVVAAVDADTVIEVAKQARRDTQLGGGHGRKRALRGVQRMSGRWERSTRTLNEQAAMAIVRFAKHHAAAIDYSAPPADCLLRVLEEEHGGPPWPFYHFREFLERKCAQHGVAFAFCAGENVITPDDASVCKR